MGIFPLWVVEVVARSTSGSYTFFYSAQILQMDMQIRKASLSVKKND
jgi:hypothetical protein